jgi:N-hydroxyarylamine O-acetyltransferase
MSLLKAYGTRVGYEGDYAPSLETLRALHLAHATHIPFENLDILLGRPIRLDLDSLCAKLIEGRRGGYCFEQNALFAAVLEAAGFRVRRLAARVRVGASGVRPRLHMLLGVEVDGEWWLADVGFGADGLLYPLPLRTGEKVAQFAWTYRIAAEGDALVLQSERPEGWVDLYSFTTEEQYAVDYEVSNHYTSTHPSSKFVKMLVAQMPGPERRLMLVNRKLIERTARGTSERVLDGDGELLEVLGECFGLEFPAGTHFPFEEGDTAAA